MSDVSVGQGTGATTDASNEPDLGWALAGLSAGAGVIHFAMTPIHAASGWQDPLGFAAAGWFQVVTAGIILAGRATRRVYQVAVVGNLVLIALWAWSRIAGLPWGESPGVAQDAGAIDAAAVFMQLGVVVIGLRLLLAPERRGVGRLAPVMAAVAALGLATTVIASPDAANHGHSDELTGLAAIEAEITETRCDTDVNIAAYWQEAEYLGIDTTFGGVPPMVEGETDGHGGGGHHGGGATSSGGTTSTTEPDPNNGRGSVGLDRLVSATGLAATSEIDAARLVTTLSESSEEDYDAWMWWLRSSGSLEHEHSATFTEEDGSGHGGHVGPQPWVAMTDQALCDQLEEELALARETALKHPTTKEAVEAGYRLVTGYVPGIAAHYIKFDLIDDTFEIDKPEMLLYDGEDEDSAIVGLSYYQYQEGDNKPTQGFTGDNDHAHRHIGLCSSPSGVIIGDSTTTAEECEARGGSKAGGNAGWMSHAWVVPGCESPWGMFSAATPVLDSELGRQSGKDGGACGGAGVRERYGLDEVPAPADGDAAGAEQSTSDTVGG